MFESLPNTRRRGQAGEDEAVVYLESQGYLVVARNVMTRAGEIDVIAQDGETLCFVEVKARRTARYGDAVGFVTPSKQRRLARAAALYLAREKIRERAMRFDVLGLERSGGGWQHFLLRDAFSADRGFLV